LKDPIPCQPLHNLPLPCFRKIAFLPSLSCLLLGALVGHNLLPNWAKRIDHVLPGKSNSRAFGLLSSLISLFEHVDWLGFHVFTSFYPGNSISAHYSRFWSSGIPLVRVCLRLVLKTEVREASICFFYRLKYLSCGFGLLDASGMMNEVFGGLRLVLFASGMLPCVCVPAACVKQWWVLSISPKRARLA